MSSACRNLRRLMKSFRDGSGLWCEVAWAEKLEWGGDLGAR